MTYLWDLMKKRIVLDKTIYHKWKGEKHSPGCGGSSNFLKWHVVLEGGYCYQRPSNLVNKH
jgi:hypothetical protein